MKEVNNYKDLMDAIPLCFKIQVYVFTSITQQTLLKYQLYFILFPGF
jgi:hypothetical protein